MPRQEPKCGAQYIVPVLGAAKTVVIDKMSMIAPNQKSNSIICSGRYRIPIYAATRVAKSNSVARNSDTAKPSDQYAEISARKTNRPSSQFLRQAMRY